MTFPALREDPLGVGASVIAVAVAGVAAGWFASQDQLLLALLPLGAAVGAAVAVARPQAVLAAAAFGSLASGEFAGISLLTQTALLATAALCGVRLIGRDWTPAARVALLPGLVLSWLGLRLARESGLAGLAPLAYCLSAVVIASFVVATRRPWLIDFTIAYVVFLAISATLGGFDPTGVRSEGIVGNPNRLAFALLVGTAIALALALTVRRWLGRILLWGLLGASVFVATLTGSAQALVGLGVIALALLVFALRRSNRALLITLATAGVCAFIAGLVALLDLGPEDLRDVSLSGRVPLYAQAVREFSANFWLGTGQLRFSSGAVVDRSAHNATLAIAAASGVLGLIGWMILLSAATVRSVRALAAGSASGIVVLVLLSSQFVQTIELLPVTWALLILAARPGKEDHHDVSRTPRDGQRQLLAS